MVWNQQQQQQKKTMPITPNYTFFVANLQKFQLVNYVQTQTVEWNRKLKKNFPVFIGEI